MADSLRSPTLARKRRARWWRKHIPLAYVLLLGAFTLVFLGVRLIDRKLPGWLTALGVSPSGMNLLIGTAWCGLGVLGLSRKGKQVRPTLVYSLCLLGGVLTLAKALGFY
jgi:hypothetical protein